VQDPVLPLKLLVDVNDWQFGEKRKLKFNFPPDQKCSRLSVKVEIRVNTFSVKLNSGKCKNQKNCSVMMFDVNSHCLLQIKIRFNFVVSQKSKPKSA